MKQVVMIGNGIAAVSAIEAFRKSDEDTPIVVISEEPYYPYYRTHLSAALSTNPDIEKLLIHSPEWYKQKNIDIRLNKKAISIDVLEKTVTLNTGEKLSFSKLLLCTGSSPFVPPVPGADLQGVFSIRTRDDINSFHEFCKDKTHGVIIGGGILGLEAAWALVNCGKKITIIERSPYILSKQLDKTASKLLTSLGRNAGIEFALEKQLAQINGDKSVAHITLEGGQKISTDFVIFSTGVRPNVEFTKDIMNCNHGIIVDELMRTSVKDIYAAGDVAEYNGQIPGIWPVAKEQGRTAGLNMSGNNSTYKEVIPSNFLKVFGKDIFSIGDIYEGEVDIRAITNLQSKENIYQVVFIKDQAPVGAILFGDIKPAMRITKAIKSKMRPLRDYRGDMNFETFLKSI